MGNLRKKEKVKERERKGDSKKNIYVSGRGSLKDSAYFLEGTRNEVSRKITGQNIPRIGRKRTTRTTTPVSHEGKSGEVERQSG